MTDDSMQPGSDSAAEAIAAQGESASAAETSSTAERAESAVTVEEPAAEQLLTAIELGDESDSLRLLKKHPELLSFVDPLSGDSVLHMASARELVGPSSTALLPLSFRSSLLLSACPSNCVLHSPVANPFFLMICLRWCVRRFRWYCIC
jgi:hypothetical protein